MDTNLLKSLCHRVIQSLLAVPESELTVEVVNEFIGGNSYENAAVLFNGIKQLLSAACSYERVEYPPDLLVEQANVMDFIVCLDFVLHTSNAAATCFRVGGLHLPRSMRTFFTI